jgi:hypothetical protein
MRFTVNGITRSLFGKHQPAALIADFGKCDLSTFHRYAGQFRKCFQKLRIMAKRQYMAG